MNKNAIEQESEKTDLEKVNFLIKIITDLSSYGTMNTIIAGISDAVTKDKKLSIIFTNDIIRMWNYIVYIIFIKHGLINILLKVKNSL